MTGKKRSTLINFNSDNVSPVQDFRSVIPSKPAGQQIQRSQTPHITIRRPSCALLLSLYTLSAQIPVLSSSFCAIHLVLSSVVNRQLVIREGEKFKFRTRTSKVSMHDKFSLTCLPSRMFYP